MTLESPYQGRPPASFWRTGIAEDPLAFQGLYRKKFEISPTDRIATAGSCFAQHIARHLRAAGYAVEDVEPAPPGMKPETARRFGYGLYSARYGNIYLARQLMQLTQEAFGEYEPPEVVWSRDGRFFDAHRPSVEPDGLDSEEEVLAHREFHLAKVRQLLENTDVFIFTLGLTEGWAHVRRGCVFPTAPGTIAGTWDPDRYKFRNYRFGAIRADLVEFRERLKSLNENARILLTVSPVPLTATAGDEHVLAATVYSKSVLRAVAGQLREEFEDVDYFPSYEIISSHVSGGAFFEPNLRSVAAKGVETVMGVFAREHQPAGAQPAPEAETVAKPAAKAAPAKGASDDDVVCEEALLDAFS